LKSHFGEKQRSAVINVSYIKLDTNQQEIKKLKTTEELLQWKEEVYELEKYAFAGIMSESEQEQRVNNLLDKNYYHRHLEKVRQRTPKLL
jgi:hypothetical protein